MILKELKTDLFSVPQGSYFCQCISADLAMGAGIAIEFNERFDLKNKLLQRYPDGVQSLRGWIPQCVFEFPVFNLITKEKHYAKPTYKSLEIALKDLKEQTEKFHIQELHMPTIGCGLDRLNWEKVRKKLIEVFDRSNITICVHYKNMELYPSKILNVYSTHLEFSPYVQGENFDFEKKLSTWDDRRRRYIPFGFFVENNTLYLPKGISEETLRGYFFDFGVIHHEKQQKLTRKFRTCEVTSPPRDEVQSQIIAFLNHIGSYERETGGSQFVLEAIMATGKTYCTVNMIATRGIRTLIIAHQQRIQEQWIRHFKEMTTMKEERIIHVTEQSTIEQAIHDPMMGDVYIMTHQMIRTFIASNGWDRFNEFLQNCEIGIKVFDEAHLFFESLLTIDLRTNVSETYYLTGTLERRDPRENAIMRIFFNHAFKFQLKTSNRKHIVYIPVMFNSNPNPMVIAGMQTFYGFSAPKYIDYAINGDPRMSLLYYFLEQFKSTMDKPGRTLVVSPTIQSSNYLADRISQETNKMVRPVNSSIPLDERATYVEKADIISSTIRSSGTGVDLPKLRFLHCLEPHVSMTTTKQLAGRLREYSSTEFTYLFDYFDFGVPQMKAIFTKHMKVMKEYAVEIKPIQY